VIQPPPDMVNETARLAWGNRCLRKPGARPLGGAMPGPAPAVEATAGGRPCGRAGKLNARRARSRHAWPRPVCAAPMPGSFPKRGQAALINRLVAPERWCDSARRAEVTRTLRGSGSARTSICSNAPGVAAANGWMSALPALLAGPLRRHRPGGLWTARPLAGAFLRLLDSLTGSPEAASTLGLVESALWRPHRGGLDPGRLAAGGRGCAWLLGGGGTVTPRRYGRIGQRLCSDDFRRSLLGAIALELPPPPQPTAAMDRLCSAETFSNWRGPSWSACGVYPKAVADAARPLAGGPSGREQRPAPQFQTFIEARPGSAATGSRDGPIDALCARRMRCSCDAPTG